MKLFLLFSIIIFSCKSKIVPTQTISIHDTIHDTMYVPTFDYEMKNNMIDEIDALRDTLFVERYKIQRVNYYLKIVKHNPKQVKFLVGWIDRAVK